MTTYQWLGDQAILASCPGESEAAQLAARVRERCPVWLIDVVQAYTSVAIFFNPELIHPRDAVESLKGLERTPLAAQESRTHLVPCCYTLGQDLERIADLRGLTPDRVVSLHAEAVYTVYAIGFCPGFPYLGYLPESLTGVPRLPSPRLRVEAGSVGLTGRQTGIYTEPRPGGWNLVGQTPLTLVDVADGFFPLRTGDKVQFVPIDESEFRRLRGQRLAG
jgi:inhibitor of KinA